MEAYLNQTEWALLISLLMLVFFMTAFFLSSSRRAGKVRTLRLPPEEDESSARDEFDQYETCTHWISLRNAGALSPDGQHGSRFLSRASLPQEIQDLMQQIGFEITVREIGIKPERHVRLEIKVNDRGYFELGRRKGPGPFEYTLPRVTHSEVALYVWQPFVNLNKEQVYHQIRFGRLKDAGAWRIVFELQSITDQFAHLDYEMYGERLNDDLPAQVDLGTLPTPPLPDQGLSGEN